MDKLLILNGSPRSLRSNSQKFILFVFPLYVDSLPCCVLEFLDCLCQNLPDSRPTVHLMINCGFLETEQNSIAIKTLQFFCKKYGFPFGSCLSIGSGEAILTPPFDYQRTDAVTKCRITKKGFQCLCLESLFCILKQ